LYRFWLLSIQRLKPLDLKCCTTEANILLLVRHWGLLLFLVGALLVYSALAPAIRVPVLMLAIAEKLVISAQILLGMNPKTRLATAAALFDAGCVVL
jgi:hypothetical protein